MFRSKRGYEPSSITETKRQKQKELFLRFLPQWQKLSTDEIATLTAILFAYLVARLKGYSI